MPQNQTKQNQWNNGKTVIVITDNYSWYLINFSIQFKNEYNEK